MPNAARLGLNVIATLRHGLRDLADRPPKTIPGLDMLRSLAILLVMSGHYGERFLHSTGIDLPITRLPLFHFGWTGVDLFFVLSGYLIGGQLWREQQRQSTINIPRFLLRRGLRIWPYYFVFLAFMVTFMTDYGWRAAHLEVHTWQQFLPDLVFLSNYLPGGIAGGWSLSTEEQFYIVVPLVLWITRPLGISRQWIVLLASLIALPISRAIAVAHFGASPGPEHPMVIYSPFHTHSDGLVIGLFIAWFSVAVPPLLAPRPLLRNLTLPALLIVLGGMLHSLNQDVFSFSALALIYGGCALFLLRDVSGLGKLTGWWGFYLLSRLSYAMYLNHFVILEWLTPKYLAAIGTHGYVAFFSGYAMLLAVSLVVATTTFLLIESPFLQLRDRLLSQKRQVLSGAVAR
jgi:peptidoglycan/LPS O-acetylase OafA/YrhL